MFCVGFLCCILLYGVASVCSVPAEMSQFKVVLLKGSLSCGFMSFWVLLSELVLSNSGSGVSLCFSHHLSLSVSALTVVSLGLRPFHSVLWRVVCLPELSPLSPFPSTVNKQPEPTPRRASAVNRKQPQLTSPTFHPLLPPLEAWVPAQPEPQPQVLSPATEAEQPGLSGGGGGGVGGGLGSGVQVATVKPQVVTQLSAEESR